jgi:putative MATE family efflux protein
MAIGGLAIAFPIQMFIMAIAQMIGIGSASIISRSLGAGDIEKADNTAGNAYISIIAISIVTVFLGLRFIDPLLRIFGASDTLLPYAKEYMQVIFIGSAFFMFAVASNNLIRAEGNAFVAMMSMIIGTGLNIILDPIFIFILDMGIRGAALATIISQFCSFIFVMIYIYSGKSQLKVKPHHLKPHKELLREIFTVGAPAFARQVGGSMLSIVLNNSLGFYGGDIAITIFGMVNRLLMFIFMPLFGVVQGLQPIAGFNYGAKKYDRVRDVIYISIKYTTIYTFIGWIIAQIFAPFFLNIFTSETDVVRMGIPILRVVVLAIPVISVQIISSAIFQAFGKAKPAMILSLLRQFILLIPMVLIFPRFFGIWGIWAAFPLSDFLATLITLVLLKSELKELKTLQAEAEVAI